MARNRQIFEDAMKKAHSYAWDERWEDAAREYEKAVAEFSDQPVVHLNLGMTYLKLGRTAEALRCYQQASDLAPEDPLPLERLATVQSQMKNVTEAATSYTRLALLWEKTRSWAQASHAWQNVITLSPDDAKAHSHLADAYVRNNQADEGVIECLATARIYREQGDLQNAIRYCDSALGLNPFHAAARSLRETLSVAQPLSLAQPLEKASAEKAGETAQEGEDQTPLSLAVQKANARLAELIFEEQAQETAPRDLSAFAAAEPGQTAAADDRRKQLAAILGRAIDYQARGVLDKAIASYRQALETGAHYPEIYFNLGVLHYKAMGYEQAIPYLQKVLDVPDYALASYFALGQCYRAQGQLEEALESYLKLLHVLDSQTGRTRTDDFLQLYQSLAGTQGKVKDRERAIAFVDAITHFLTGRDWRERLDKVRKQLEDVATGDVIISLAEIVEVPGSERVLEGLQRSRKFLAQNLPMAAIEECYGILDVAPTYLPVHTQLAEIFLHKGQIEQAVAKYAAIATTYQIRGDTSQAVKVYQRILEITPLDVTVRPKLISLLIGLGQIDEALEAHLALADAYYQQVQLDKTLEQYNQALNLAARGSPERNWPVTIMKKTADLYIQRLDWSRASAVYQEIKRLTPLDEAAAQTLVDLYYRAGQRRRAEAEIDELLNQLREAKRWDDALQWIRRLIENRPTEAGLRRRAARLLLERGRKDEAVDELDTLGEQQLEQGQVKEALITVRQIISLNPRHVAAYQQLLRQLEEQVQSGAGGN